MLFVETSRGVLWLVRFSLFVSVPIWRTRVCFFLSGGTSCSGWCCSVFGVSELFVLGGYRMLSLVLFSALLVRSGRIRCVP